MTETGQLHMVGGKHSNSSNLDAQPKEGVVQGVGKSDV